MIGSARAFLDAVEAFGSRLAAVDWRLLALAVACGILNLVCRARAWQGVLRAAAPADRVRYRTALGAYCAGVGVNAIIPARVGDLVKILLVRRGMESASFPLLAGSLLAETVFDMFVAGALIVWVVWAGFLPGLRLPDIPAFDLSLAVRYPWLTAVFAVLVALAIVFGTRRIRRFWRQFGQGLTVLRSPVRYLRSVATWQAVGWCFRLGGAFFFLGAFGLPQTVTNALIVLVAGSLGGLFPATPAGVGPKQALAVVMLAGEAQRSAVLAFSAGMELTLVIVNVLLATLSIALMLRTIRLGRVIRAARDQGTPPPAGRGGPSGERR